MLWNPGGLHGTSMDGSEESRWALPIKMLFRLVFAAWYRLYLVLVASPAIL